MAESASPNHGRSQAGSASRRARIAIGSLGIALLIALAAAAIAAFKSRSVPVYYVIDKVTHKLNQPVGITHAGDERLFIHERAGRVRILAQGRILPEPFLDLRDRVSTAGSIEQGLLGLAFDPDYASNGILYTAYSDAEFTLHLERFRVSSDPNRADPQSGERLLSIPQTTPTHKGGHLRFGSDGSLYMSVGDGGLSSEAGSTGQNKDDLLGKILRLDMNSTPYGIPADNPFVDDPAFRPEIWAWGLRNPWQFSFAPSNDAFITDVGWSHYEEINYAAADAAGPNYGWRFYEGAMTVEPPGTAPASELTFPIYAYPHLKPPDYDGSTPYGCAVIGGFVYDGAARPELRGQYLFSDFCGGDIWTLSQQAARWQAQRLIATDLRVTALATDAGGEIYIADFLGRLYRLKAAPADDIDDDLVLNDSDNCPQTANVDQADNWGALGVGDACDQSFYVRNHDGIEVKVFQQHYGAFHIYGCDSSGCGLMANLDAQDLRAQALRRADSQIASQHFSGWRIALEYAADSDSQAVYSLRIVNAAGDAFVDDLQILIDESSLAWRTTG